MTTDVYGWAPADELRYDALGEERQYERVTDTWSSPDRHIYGMALDTAVAEYGLRAADEIEW